MENKPLNRIKVMMAERMISNKEIEKTKNRAKTISRTFLMTVIIVLMRMVTMTVV